MSYTKYHSVWAETDLLSGRALNHIESQYSEIKSDINLHNHNNIYYTKTQSDFNFYTLTSYADFDADMLDGLHVSDLASAILPVGAILIWSGDLASIPEDWALCDGTSGTPDLRDRFLIGAGNEYAVGQIGGPSTYNGEYQLSGDVLVGTHQLTVNEIPSHTHDYTEYAASLKGAFYSSSAASYSGGITTRSISTNTDTIGDAPHGHPGSTISMSQYDPRPPYKAYYYIIKVA